VRKDSARGAEVKRIPWGFESKSSGGTTFHMHSEDSSKGVRRRERRQRLRPLALEILPSLGRKRAGSSGGSTTAVRSAGEKRSGPLVFTSRKASGEAHRRGDCGPSDVHTKSRQPLDREKMLGV
jgi:hypothetical protein